MPDTKIPKTQYAVQLVGPDELKLNTTKAVPAVGPTQILLRAEAVGLCFSDLKLLKQFTAHARNSEVVSGISPEALAEIPSYGPGEAPTVPGHEAVARIVAVGQAVERHKIGERVMVQADWRQLRTAKSNGAFGYNFEGALQEYILLDERVVIDPATDERYLIPADEAPAAAAVALVEPWACVEDSYVTVERRTIKAGGHLLVVVESGATAEGVEQAYVPGKGPKEITDARPDEVAALPDEAFDDIVYFGARAETVEALGDKLARRGIFNIVTAGESFGRPVSVDVGRVHYGLCRWCGTTSASAAESYKNIPETGDIRNGDKILIVGAGGPMGQMHVIRNLCEGKKDISLVATDFDSPRLEYLFGKAAPLAKAHDTRLRMVNSKDLQITDKFNYIALMAPVADLVTLAISDSIDGCRINIFAGIPAGTKADLDIDTYIANRCWMFGTSGSTIDDMKLVLQKVESGQLDTNCSVDAVCGMAGAIEGVAAVEKRTLAGKIIVYPALHDVGLIPLTELAGHYPTVAEKLENGMWTKAAETELLRTAAHTE